MDACLGSVAYFRVANASFDQLVDRRVHLPLDECLLGADLTQGGLTRLPKVFTSPVRLSLGCL